MQLKLTISVDSGRSVLYVQLILKICISQFFKIIRSKIEKALIHLETAALTRLNQFERNCLISRLFFVKKIRIAITDGLVNSFHSHFRGNEKKSIPFIIFTSSSLLNSELFNIIFCILVINQVGIKSIT